MMYHKLKYVLIVEDMEDQRVLLKLFIESMGLKVLTAENGLVATEFLEDKPIDLLITDFRMPHMDGVSLLNWCRERSFDMPVIFLSAEAQLFNEEELALKDCCSLLIKTKPMSLALLSAAIRAADQHDRTDCAFQTFKEAFQGLVADKGVKAGQGRGRDAPEVTQNSL